MKKSIIIAVFSASAILAAALRLCQMLAFTEYKTGFIERGGGLAFALLSVAIGLLVLGVPAFALLSGPAAAGGKPFNIALSLSSILLSGACVADVLTLASAEGALPGFLKILYLVLGSLCAAYFAAAGVRSVIYFPFPSQLAVIPPAFLTVRAACIFIACSRLSLISDTVFEVFVYCASMLLFLEIARAVNGAGSKLSTKKIAFFGLAVSLSSICSALPELGLAVFYPSALHAGAAGSVITLALGVYAAVLVFSRIDFKKPDGTRLGVYYEGKH